MKDGARVVDARFVTTVAGRGGLPDDGLPEVAFLGRSNAGKSTLLNALAGRRELARVSATPGKTRAIHFYRIERLAPDGARHALLFVDLPGYGFARVSKAERAAWRGLVEGYLTGRAPLRAAVLVQDLRRDPSDDERELLAWLAARGIPAIVALTKADKLARGARTRRVHALAAAYAADAAAVVATAARTGEGIADLWRALDARIGQGAPA